MKKLIALLLAAVLVLSLAACGKEPVTESTGDSADGTTASTTAPTTKPTKATEPPTTEPEEVIGINLPAAVFSGVDMATFDADAYAKENNYLGAKVNEDGSVSVNMTESRYAQMLAEAGELMEQSMDLLVDATPYIQKITFCEDFSLITILVDRAGYESTVDFTPLYIGITVTPMQQSLGIPVHMQINIVDASSGQTLNSTAYPETQAG